MTPDYKTVVRKTRRTTSKIFLQTVTPLFLLAFLLFGFNTLQAQSVGGVYAMTNGNGQVDGNVQGPNAVVAYGQAADGTLTLLGTYPTGGNGGDFDGGEGLDPLISAYAITKTLDNRFVLAVNAGSSSVTAMKVNADFSLTVTDTESTQDVGPNSIAFKPSSMPGVSGLVYVSNITRAEFLALGEPGHQGSLIGYRLMDNGDLIPVENSLRNLANRPSAVQFSPDGNYLVAASINSGASGLGSGNEDEIVLYRVNGDGTLSANQTDGAASTLRGNTEGRNLPSAIGFQIVGDNYVVVTEAREFQPNGAPPAFPALQDGSVSTWQIMPNGTFRPVDLDVASGENNTGRTACWLDFSDDNTFFVSNAIEAGLAAYSFNNGDIELLDQVAAQGTGATGNTTDPAAAFGTTEGWIDMWISDDGKYLYQLFGLTGEIGVYGIDGTSLTFIEKISGDLPVNNTQGIVAVGPPAAQEVTAAYRIIFDATWSEVTHPADFPAEEPNIARWSPVAGMTHNGAVQLFREGTIATQGIVNISQTGSRQPLDAEIANYIDAGHAETYIESATRVRPSPDTISTTFTASASHPYLSLASMIAPSPDWFVGFNNLNLVEDGKFVESKVIQFVPYDSGSDSGASFASDNQDTQPRETIFKITDGVLEGENGYIPSLGIWRIERIDAASSCNAHGGYVAGGPFTFTVDGTADNIPAGALTLTGQNGAFNQWVVTDDRGNILGLPGSFTGPNFDAAGVGVCFIRNLAYDDGLEGLAVGNNIEDLSGCFSLSNGVYINRVAGNTSSGPAVGAVYAMTNGEGQIDGNVQGPNAVVAYGQAADGTLSIIGTYPTGGNGGDFDGGEGLDPLISAYAITKTIDNRFVLAVNAGSNSVTSMRVNPDFSLTVIDTESTGDVGPNSIAHTPSAMAGVNGVVYVSNITRAEFLALGEPGHQGSLIGYKLMDDGSLEPIANSTRDLANRPSAVQFSPDGNYLVAASINSGASGLGSGNEDEIVLYRVNADGTLSANQTDGATSTLRGNTEGRNLPSAIGFQIVGDNYVVVTEAREFQPNGAPPAFPALQDGSVSTWQIMPNGTFRPVDLDVASGENNTGRTACWLDFSDDNTFFVSNAIEAGLAAYSFNNGDIELLDQVAAQGTGATGNTTDPAAAFGTTEGWIDMWISDDGKYLYQLFGLTGEIGVYGIDGTSLTFIEKISGDLPVNNTQGIVSVGQPRTVTPPVAETTARYRVTFDAAWSALTHPTDFPADEPNIARFSPVAGMTHNTSTQLFEEGTIASPGIVEISQSGSRQPLDAEIAALIDGGYAETYIESATRVRPSPDTISTTFEVSTSHPYLSLTSMIAPSPDWIVGFNNLNLVEDGKFIESRIVQFVPYDTGSDSGESFASDNLDTQPRAPIFEITDGPLSSNGQINSIGIWRIERIDGGSTCNVAGGSIAGGPFSYCVDGEADNIPAGAISLSGNSGANSQWVVTDERGYILGLPPSFTAPNFDAAGVGVCFVWHLSYEDGLQGLAMGNNIESLDGCFNLSNSIYVERKECVAVCEVNGGNIVGGPFEFCVGDGEADHIPAGAILTEGKKGSNSQYVVTDDLGNILGLPPTPDAVNFEGAGPGLCLVWHLSYEDDLTGLAVGNNISELAGCYDLSNQIRVVRNNSGEICEAGATCNPPSAIQIDVLDSRRVRMDWENVDNAAKYFVQIRFQGQTRIVAAALIRHSRLHLFGPSGRAYEVRFQTICKDGSQSEFTEWIPFSTPPSGILVSTAAQGRSADDFIADITIGEEAIPMTTFPNPVSDVLNVYYKTTTETAVLSVYHISGKKISTIALGKDATSHQVNVANLTNGVYLVRIDEAGQVPVTKRVVKGSRQ